MQKWIIMALLLGVSQVSSARVYMCVDSAGKAYFTDAGCATEETREEVRIEAANLESGKSYVKSGKRKTWNSEREERKSGLDYNDERRSLSSSGLASTP